MLNLKRKVLSVFLMTAAIFTAASIIGFSDAYALSGEGTEDQPYQISTEEDWEDFAGDVRAGNSKDKYYSLLGNIEINIPVGTANNPFEGHFDGNGNTITAEISDIGEDGTAPFRYIRNAEIKYLNVDGTIRGNDKVSGLVGICKGDGSTENTIRGINVSADVDAGTLGEERVGGIVGDGQNAKLTIDNCWFNGNLSGTEWIGGILGWSEGQDLTIRNCLFSGSYQKKKTISKFHPIGIRTSVSVPMTLHLDGAYYENDTPSTMAGDGHALTNDGITVYKEADADLSAGHFYKAVRFVDQYTGYYYPVKTVSLELGKSFYRKGVDTKVTFTVKADGESLTDTDFGFIVKPPNSPPNPNNAAIFGAGAYKLTVNGKENYLGKLETEYYVADMTGSGTASDPYMINNVNDWNQFADILKTGSGETFAGNNLKLGNNITVSTMAGTESHPFSGTFDGNGKTLTSNITSDEQGAAPFHYIKGATIKNITAAGSVTGKEYSSGLVGFALGEDNNTVNKVDHATVTANVTVNDYGSGVVGHGKRSTVEIDNTIFSGKITCNLFNRRYTGAGFLVSNQGARLKMTNCINKGSKGCKFYWWNPVAIFAHDNFTSDIDTTYYKENVAKGDDDFVTTPNVGGSLAHTSAISGKVSTKVKAVDNVTYYIDEGIKITGIKPVYKYTGSEVSVPFKAETAGGKVLVKDTDYTSKFNKTVKEKGEYTLTVTFKGNYTGSLSAKFRVADQLNGSGTADDPYLINNANDWTFFKGSIGYGHTYKDEFVKLTGNISIGNVMAGTENYPFEGKFDGTGHTITASISGSAKGAAPFSYVKGATIKDLTIAGSVTGGDYSSGLVGIVKDNPVTISNVEVKTTVKSGKHLSGFIGNSNKTYYNNLSNCIFSGELSCTGNEGYIGGFAGWSDLPAYGMTNCLFKGKVTGKVKLFHPAGIYNTDYSGYYGNHNGKVYYTTSGAPKGSADSYASVLKDWNIEAIKVYSRNELQEETLYKTLSINGKSADCYQRGHDSNSGIIVDEKYFTREGVPAAVDPKVQVDGEDATSSFTFKYYQEDVNEPGSLVEIPEEEISLSGTYTVKATVKTEDTYAGSASAEFQVAALSGQGTEDDPYFISSTNDWNSFADAVAAGHTFKDEFLIIANSDVDVLKSAGTTQYPFKGTIDGEKSGGNGNQTLHVDLDDTASQGTAPFRYVADGAVIRNVDVEGTVKGGRHAGGLVGFADSGKVEIENVNVSATISDADYVGGIIGHGKKSDLTISHAVYSGKITGGSSFAGGLLGWSDGQKLTMNDCIFKGRFFGSGSFHPIAVKNSGMSMNTNLHKLFYVSTQAPAIGGSNIAAAGTPVYSQATYPENKLVSVVRAADNKDYYAETAVGELEESYEITADGIAPVPSVFTIDGSRLTNGKDYTAVYYNTESPQTALNKVIDAGEYSAVLKGDGTTTLGQQEAGTFTARSNHVTSVSLNTTEAVLNFDEGKNTIQLVETVHPDGAPNKEVVWTSSDADVAAVDNTGLVTAKSVGNAVITVAAKDETNGKKSATCAVTVEKSAARMIAYPQAVLLTYTGETQQLLDPGTAIGGTVVYKGSGQDAFSEDIPVGTNAGTYSVAYKIQGDEFHTDSEEMTVDAAIAKAPNGALIDNNETVKAGNSLNLGSLVSGAADRTMSFEITDDIDNTGSTISGSTFTAGAAGQCVVTATVAEDDNYLAQQEEIVINIETKDIRQIGVTMDDWTYGDEPKEPVFEDPGDSAPDGVFILYSGTTRSGDSFVDDKAPTEAGTYQVGVIYEDEDFFNIGEADFVILPRSIEGAEVTLGDSLTYTGEDQEQSVSKVELGGNDITGSCDVSANHATNAGDHNLVVTARANSNYTGLVNVPFTVAKADPTFTPPTAIEDLVYDGSIQVLITPGTVQGGVMKYNNNGQGSYPDPDENGNERLPVGQGAGTYRVNYTVRGDANHNNIYGNQYFIEVTIAKAPCTVDTEPKAISDLVYTGEAQALVTKGTSASGDITYRLGDDENAEFTAAVPKAKDAGEYHVYYKAEARDEDHADSAVAGPVNVTIGKKACEITEAPEAVEGLTYDGEEHALVTAGKTNGGDLLYRLGEDGEFAAEIPAASDVGSYKVYYKVDGDDNSTGTEIMGPVNAEISKAPFPGKILRYGLSAGYGEQVDISQCVSSDAELEYEINSQDPDDLGCQLDGSVLTTGSKSGKAYVDIKVKGDSGNYNVEDVYINVSDIKWTDINVAQNSFTYGKGQVDPGYEEYGDESQISGLTFTYFGTLLNGKNYGLEEEEINTPPTEAGSYSVMVYYMIGRNAYGGTAEFTIKAAPMQDAKVTLGKELKYTGEKQTQEVAKIEYAGSDITDLCEISNNTATETGNYNLTITPKAEAFNYFGTANVKFTVYPDDKTLAAAKEAALKEIGNKYKPSEYSGKAKTAVENAIAKARRTISNAKTLEEIENAKAEIAKTISASKKTNTIKVKGKKVKVKAKKLKKKTLKIKKAKALKVTQAKGKVTCKRVKITAKKKLLKQAKKKIKVAKNGKITLKKGLKKGTYKVKVKVRAAGDKYYAVGTKTVTVKIVVK